MGWARGVANRAFTETVAVSDGHGNGHGAIEGPEHAAVGAGEPGESGEHGGEEH
jgi:hypothetical protein